MGKITLFYNIFAPRKSTKFYNVFQCVESKNRHSKTFLDKTQKTVRVILPTF